MYDRELIDYIGGYHFDDDIHWEEDREHDFRLQLAGVEVSYVPEAVVYHAAQTGFSDLRSAFRYGMGEGIGQEKGLFLTPRLSWRLRNDLGSIVECSKRKGTFVAMYRSVWLLSYHLGTLYHTLFDPYDVRKNYPATAKRMHAQPGIPGHITKLTDEHKVLLRQSLRNQGIYIKQYTPECKLEANTYVSEVAATCQEPASLT